MQEAVIKFASESAASTACLLNNALVDGTNIKVDMFPLEEKPTRGTTPTSEAAVTNDSFTSIFSGLASTGKAFASTIATKVKAFDQQYGVSETVIAGASTAWSESKRIASDIDTKYHVKETVSSAVQTTKEKVITAADKISNSGTPQASSSPRTASPRPVSPNKF